jgi:hypothetical protein
MLVLDTRRRAIEIAQVPSPADEQQALAALREQLQFPGTQDETSLPDGWEETLLPEGVPAVVRDTRARRRQSLALGGIAAVAGVMALVLGTSAMAAAPVLGPAAGFAVIAAVAALGAWWLDAGRQEITTVGGQVVVQRRWRGKVKELFVAHRLELELSTDSDGDAWYKLQAHGLQALDARTRRPKKRRTLASAMNDPFEPTALGRWLAAKAGVPFEGP